MAESPTKISPDMIDIPDVFFGELPHDAVINLYVPVGNGSYKAKPVTLGYLQTLFNSGAPGGGDVVTLVTGGEVDSGDPENAFWDGGLIDGDDATVKLSGGTFS